MGLHRDGASLGLLPFETEMRRRLWWQIVLLDGHIAQLAGTSVSAVDWDTQVPSNLNDSDLSPETKELPREHVGATEMIHCLIRYEFRDYFRETVAKVSSTNSFLQEKDRSISELENRLESKYLRYCDPLVPLHVASVALARSSICKMRLVAHHPGQYPDKGASLPREERDMLFATSLKMMEYDTLCQATPSVGRFHWHLNVTFQLDAFVFMLSELRGRSSEKIAESAWEQIQSVYHYHPDLITDTKNPLYVAIGTLTLRAWELRETALERQLQRMPEVPQCITLLRSQRKDSSNPKTPVNPIRKPATMSVDKIMTGEQQPRDSRAVGNIPPAADMTDAFQMDVQFDPVPIGLSPMDWDYWNDLLQANELQMAEASWQLFGQT